MRIVSGSNEKQSKQDSDYNGVTLHTIISNDVEQDRDKIIKKMLKFHGYPPPLLPRARFKKLLTTRISIPMERQQPRCSALAGEVDRAPVCHRPCPQNPATILKGEIQSNHGCHRSNGNRRSHDKAPKISFTCKVKAMNLSTN